MCSDVRVAEKVANNTNNFDADAKYKIRIASETIRRRRYRCRGWVAQYDEVAADTILRYAQSIKTRTEKWIEDA